MKEELKAMSLEEIQSESLAILKIISLICDKLNITYWIMYGTLLGAVRHKGFIPWDDDLDIGLKRADYDILVQYFLEHAREVYPLKIHNRKTVKGYPFYISRICDMRFKCKFKHLDYESGLFVDIYPFDGMGNEGDIAYWEKNFKRYRFIEKEAYVSSVKGYFYGRNFVNKIINLPLCIYCKSKGSDYFIERLEAESQRFDWETSSMVGVPVWGGEFFVVEKKCFTEFIKLPFEDFSATAPKHYEKILTELYENYMKFPPEDKRVPQHDYTAYRIVEEYDEEGAK